MTQQTENSSAVNPFPGARPLSAVQADLLFGRDLELRTLRRALDQHCVVQIAGGSGAGKTSLLRAGLQGRMAASAGLDVVVFSDWASVRGNDPADWYVSALRLALGELGDVCDATDPIDFLTDIQAHYGRELIVVFDQLEELLREDQSLGTMFLEQVAEVGDAFPTGYRQLLSFRHEYRYALTELERNLDSALWTYLTVRHVDPGYLDRVVQQPLASIGLAASPELVSELKAAWAMAIPDAYVDKADTGGREGQTGDQIGLLHVQAFLKLAFSLDPPDPESDFHPEGALDKIGVSWPSQLSEARDFFDEVIAEYVAFEVGAQKAALRRRLLSKGTTEREADQLVSEVLRVARRVPASLSSAGFKLVRSTAQLAELALPELNDLAVLKPGANGEKTAKSEVSEIVAFGEQRWQHLDPETLVNVFLDQRPEVDELVAAAPQLAGWGDDGMVCGRLNYGGAVDAAVVLLAQFHEALRWLTESSLLRGTGTRAGVRVVSLVHDGFGSALSRWADSESSARFLHLSSFVTLTGQRVLNESTEPDSVLDPNALFSTQSLGWVGCNISASFSGILFENCNFSGSLFKRCHFKNVTFTNCNLWGTLFLECSFEGCSFEGDAAALNTVDGTAIRGLTLGFGCEIIGPGGLAFSGLQEGYGLFLDGVSGGPLTFRTCVLDHVMLKGTETELLGPIVLSSDSALNGLTRAHCASVRRFGGELVVEEEDLVDGKAS